MNRDFSDMLSALSEAGAEYLVVGAYALAVHGVPRATGDIDLWIRPSPSNAQRAWDALVRFGAPLAGVRPEDLASPGIVLQIGVAPGRIDLLTSIDGVAFEDAWSDRVELIVEGLRVPVLGRAHLVTNKRAAGRPKDLADLALLEEISPR